MRIDPRDHAGGGFEQLAIMVAADSNVPRVDEDVGGFTRLERARDMVAEVDNEIGRRLLADVGEHGAKSVEVSVNVGDGGDSHVV